MASRPPRRTLPSGVTISTRHSSTKMFAARRKNQSKVDVIAGRSQPKIASASCWSASVNTTKAMMVSPETMNTGLWMSIPNGPILVLMLSCPIS